MLTGVRNGTCSISWRSGGNHILSGCPGITAAVVCSPTVPAARSDSLQLYEWQSSASGTDSIQQLQSAAGQRPPAGHTSRPASSTDTESVCAGKYDDSDIIVIFNSYKSEVIWLWNISHEIFTLKYFKLETFTILEILKNIFIYLTLFFWHVS